jgi:hypothetical protein
MAVDERLPQLCKPSLLVVHTVQCNFSIQRTIHTPRCLWACTCMLVLLDARACALVCVRVGGWVGG